MIPKALNEIAEADLQGLISQGVEEGVTLDYKRDLPGDDKDSRKEFLADVCSFANTRGGDLVYGIGEDAEGRAGTIHPAVFNADECITKLSNVISDGLEPKLHGVTMHAVPVEAGGNILVIRIPRSFSGIHRSARDAHFWIRESKSKRQLDVPGVISRVADQLGREDRVTAFFAKRYADIMTNEHSLLMAKGPKLVVHLVPARNFLAGEQVDVDSIQNNAAVPLLNSSGGHSQRRTFDGHAFYDAYENTAHHFTMFLRNGVVEACSDLIVAHGPDQEIDLAYTEKLVLEFLATFETGGFAQRSTGYPYLVKVALLGTPGYPCASGLSRMPSRNTYGLPIRQTQPVLALSEVLIQGPNADLGHEMHSAFVRMWHAWGYTNCLTYTLAGDTWRRRTT